MARWRFFSRLAFAAFALMWFWRPVRGAEGAPAAGPTEASADPAAAQLAPGDSAGHGLKRAGDEIPIEVKKDAIHVRVHKEAKDWEPVSVRVIGDAGVSENSVTRKSRGAKRGQKSSAKAVARLHRQRGDKLLIISLYPGLFKKSGTHFEVRLRVVEGFLEGAKIAAVTLKGGQGPVAYGAEDSVTLSREGLEFHEDFPAEAQLKIAAVDAKPGKSSRNAGSVSGADFGGKELGTISLFYGVDSVSADRGR